MKAITFFTILTLAAAALVGCATAIDEPPDPTPSPESSGELSEFPADAGWACSSPQPANWGGSGLGDPYSPLWGNGGYDVQHYDIRLNVDVENNNVQGVTTITARADQDLDAFNLDFMGMKISGASVNGVEMEYCRDDEGEMTVLLSNPVALGDVFTTSIAYQGTPMTFDGPYPYVFGWVKDGRNIATSGTSNDPAFLYPNNEYWSDTATYTVQVTVPEGYSATTVGELVDETRRNDSVVTLWNQDLPSNTIILSINFDAITETVRGPNGLAISFEYPALMEDHFSDLVKDIPDMVAFFSSLFGPFPYDTLGITVTSNRVVGISMPTRIFIGSEQQDWYLHHELAHQWIGNSLRVTSWEDGWIPEGLATYAQTLWLEHKGEEADDIIKWDYFGLPAETHPPGYASPEDWEPGGAVVYLRPSIAMHALRLRVGDEAFFAILQTFNDRFTGEIIHSDDFFSVAEEVSGQDLEDFFNSWIYQEAVPDIPEIGLSKTGSSS